MILRILSRILFKILLQNSGQWILMSWLPHVFCLFLYHFFYYWFFNCLRYDIGVNRTNHGLTCCRYSSRVFFSYSGRICLSVCAWVRIGGQYWSWPWSWSWCGLWYCLWCFFWFCVTAGQRSLLFLFKFFLTLPSRHIFTEFHETCLIIIYELCCLFISLAQCIMIWSLKLLHYVHCRKRAIINILIFHILIWCSTLLILIKLIWLFNNLLLLEQKLLLLFSNPLLNNWKSFLLKRLHRMKVL